MRLRLCEAASLATRVVFSNSAMVAEDLAHENRGRGVLDEVCGRRRRDEGDPLRLEHVVAREPHHEVTSEAVSVVVRQTLFRKALSRGFQFCF